MEGSRYSVVSLQSRKWRLSCVNCIGVGWKMLGSNPVPCTPSQFRTAFPSDRHSTAPVHSVGTVGHQKRTPVRDASLGTFLRISLEQVEAHSARLFAAGQSVDGREQNGGATLARSCIGGGRGGEDAPGRRCTRFCTHNGKTERGGGCVTTWRGVRSLAHEMLPVIVPRS